MHVVDHLSIEELRRHASRESETRRLLRIRVVILAREGRTAPQIAAALGCSRRAAQHWVARYNAEERIKSVCAAPYLQSPGRAN